MADKITVKDKETSEVLMIIEGEEVKITEALEEKRKRKKKVVEE
jgi:hypothetical protein